ncbi:MAG: hypothetical protein Kow0042_30180 [Calditrichia bacterium]
MNHKGLKNRPGNSPRKGKSFERNLTIYQVMEKLGKSRQTIYDYMKRGLPYTQKWRLYFSEAEVNEFMARLKQERAARRRARHLGYRQIHVGDKLHRQLLELSPNKQTISIASQVVERGLERLRAGAEPHFTQGSSKKIQIKNELYDELRRIAKERGLTLAKVTNAVIRCGLEKS